MFKWISIIYSVAFYLWWWRIRLLSITWNISRQILYKFRANVSRCSWRRRSTAALTHFINQSRSCNKNVLFDECRLLSKCKQLLIIIIDIRIRFTSFAIKQLAALVGKRMKKVHSWQLLCRNLQTQKPNYCQGK